MSREKARADLVIKNIGQLLTLRGFSKTPLTRPNEKSLGIIGKGSCVASSENGRICYVGNLSNLSESIRTTAADEIDAKGKLVMPGFVDSHTHALFAGSREEEIHYKLSGLSYLEILKRGGGIMKTVAKTRKASDATIIQETRERLDRMLSSGTTTFEIKSGYGLTLESEIRLLQILKTMRGKKFGYDIVPTLLSAHALPDEFSAKRYIDEVVFPSIDISAEKNLARFCDVFLENGVFGRDDARAILGYAREKGLGLKIHADEFSDTGGATLAAEMKVASADHLLQTSPSGIRALAKSGVVSVLLPGTTLASFAPAFANARGLIDSGAPVALASDLSPNSWVESMQFVIVLACYAMRMTQEEAIAAATINGAHAIGRAGDVGSIEQGKACDLLICDVPNYEMLPYRIGSNCVKLVIKNGKLVREN